MNQLESHSVSQISGEYVPPGDKSISHRLAMLGALASGTSTFSNFLNSDDCLRTIKAFETMSVQYDLSQGKTSAKLKVKGAGLNGLKAPSQALDLGNSGTTMRLLLGILAGQPFETSLTGDPSLSKRPMRRVTEPLRKMGARIKGKDDANYAPLTIQGGHLKGIHWRNEVASAQVKSAILLAGLFAEGETSVEEPIPSRDHTERLLKTFGVPVFKNNFKISVRKANRFDAIQFVVPGDISSAAFFMVAALLIPGSELFIRQTGLNPTRIGLIRILKSMGADITLEAAQDQGEPIGNIHVKASRLKGITIEKNLIPSLIDELPILMIACALAEGASVIRGAEELRVKETDRIHSMVSGLNTIGGKAEEREDGCVIQGISEFQGGTISSFGDHRTAMSFLIAGLRSKSGVTVQDTDCIQTSYPNFEADLQSLTG
ncbi:MAG: 3-phosphoshikimate 1-carboxyvinyltransferase [Omnitrophica bacterium RIFCSPHIGHO2_02_FULL_46_11]|nr:MAG: 3-phosphoshikimate 1-carboxyvinyltransferase [Omnitrophica bacterium RIFCSPHIGHO2_02_FULL_46_11]